MSLNNVVPLLIISTHAFSTPTLTNSGETQVTSEGQMYFPSQSCNFTPSTNERNNVIAEWVCMLHNPGMIACSGNTTCCSLLATYFPSTSSVLSTSTIFPSLSIITL